MSLFSSKKYKAVQRAGVLFLILFFFFSFSALSHAQTEESKTKKTSSNGIMDVFTKMIPQPENSYVDLGEGEWGIRELVVYYMGIFKDIVAAIAVLLIIISGIRIITSDAKDDVDKSQKAILWLMVGLIIMNVAEGAVSIMYGQQGVYHSLLQYDTEVPKALGEKLIEPIMKYFLNFVAAVAVLMVIFSGLRIMTSSGDEGKMKKQQQVLFWAMTGLVIILIAKPVIGSIFGYDSGYNPKPKEIINIIAQLANYVMGFMVIISVLMLIVAGVMMVINFGNDQMIQKAKKIVLWVLVGLCLMVSAYTIVTFFIAPG